MLEACFARVCRPRGGCVPTTCKAGGGGGGGVPAKPCAARPSLLGAPPHEGNESCAIFFLPRNRQIDIWFPVRLAHAKKSVFNRRNQIERSFF